MDQRHLISSADPDITIFQKTSSSVVCESLPTAVMMTYGSRTIARYDKSGLGAAHSLSPIVATAVWQGHMPPYFSTRNFLTVDPSGPVVKSQLYKLETAVMVFLFFKPGVGDNKGLFQTDCEQWQCLVHSLFSRTLSEVTTLNGSIIRLSLCFENLFPYSFMLWAAASPPFFIWGHW